jgi:hypothetical protein
MKLVEKIQNVKPYYWLAFTIATLAIIYFIMTFILGLYYWSDNSSFTFVNKLHHSVSWVIFKTSIYPVSIVWNNLPAIPIYNIDVLEFYRVVIPPVAIFTICMIYMSYYRALKTRYNKLNAKVNGEIELDEIRELKGRKKAPDNAVIDIVINDESTIKPTWHESFSGKIVTAVLIAMILTALSLN